MFKFETVVKAVVFTLLVMSASGWAKDKSEDEDEKKSPTDPYRRCEVMAKIPTITEDKVIKCLDDAQRIAGGGFECPGAFERYQSAKKEFVAACSAIPNAKKINAKEELKAGNIACAATILNCTKVPNAIGDGDKINIAAERERFNYCPILAGKDLAALQAEVKEARKDIREMKNKLPQLQDALAEAQSQAAEKQAEAQKQMGEAAKERGKALKEVRDQKDQAQGQLVEQMLQLQGELTKVEERRGSIRVQRAEAAAARVKAIADIDLRCHEEASLSVRKLQEQRLALESTRQYNRGSFNKMMEAVGVSDREAWQRVAAKYFRWCMQSSPTRKLKEQANDAYEVTQKKSDADEEAIDREKADIRNRISKIKNSNGCMGGARPDSGGEPTESAMCRATRKAVEDAAQAEQDYRTSVAQAQTQMLTAINQAKIKRGPKMAAIGQMENDIRDEEARVRNLAEYLALKRQFSGGKDVTEDEAKEARIKMAALGIKAAAVFHCIKELKDKDGSRNREELCAEDNLCYEAVHFSSLQDNDATTFNAVDSYKRKEKGEIHRRDDVGGAIKEK